MVDLAQEPAFALGVMQVHAARRQVECGGTVESLEPRIMQVLVVLARNRGRVVSRQELIDACWDGRIVVNDALNRCISAIRRLSETYAGFTIKTVPRVGYLLEEVTAPLAETPQAVDVTPAKHERRHVTVLSCTLVRAPGAATSVDPEEWRAIVTDYRRAAQQSIEQFDGHVSSGPGNAVAAYFGFPRAREDAAERAVRAGLAVVESIDALARQSTHELRLSAQIGIHSGGVVVGRTEDGATEMFGDASDVAAFVQGQAAAGTVLITPAVLELVEGRIESEPYREVDLHGSEVLIHRATGVRRSGRGRPLRPVTPFVGREQETQLLLDRFRRARSSDGQFVLVSGEPGIGKSRLIAELEVRLAEGFETHPHRWIECGGAALFANTPFHALTAMLVEGLKLQALEPVQSIEVLERVLDRTELRLVEAVPLIAGLLNIPVPSHYPKLIFSPDQRRRRLFAVALEWIFSTRPEEPLVVVVEDLHWVDPSTLELVQMLAEQGATAPLLLVCTARPEFQPPWAARSHHTRIDLPRLNSAETRELVRAATNAELQPDAVDVVIARSDGIPLFAEELARLMLEPKARSDPRQIPTTLRDSLSARLDGLDQAKGVAQLCAVLGREFTYDLLREISPLPDAELQSALAKLADAELILERGVPPDASYRFRHTLIQDAAYEALLKSERRELHARVAKTISERCPEVAASQPELLARHWTDAGETELAIAAWIKAAAAARARQAHREAEEGIRCALELLATLPESPERDVREMELVSDLGSALQILRGEAAPEAVAALVRCRALAEKGGSIKRQIAVLLQTCSQTMVTGNVREAALLADQLLELAKREGSDASLAPAHQIRFFAAHYLGDFESADLHYAAWRRIWEPGGQMLTYRVRDGLTFASLRALFAGYDDVARERFREADECARGTGDPYEIAGARAYEAVMHSQLEEFASAEVCASESLVICEERGLGALAAIARTALGRAWTDRGRAPEGLALMRRGIAELIAFDYWLPVPGLKYTYSRACSVDGQHAEALVAVEEGLRFNPYELAYRPEGLIARGTARFALGQTDLAVRDFIDAIELAQHTRARLSELRAATALATLLRSKGEVQAARDVLKTIHTWFVGRSNMAAVRRATELLQALEAAGAVDADGCS